MRDLILFFAFILAVGAIIGVIYAISRKKIKPPAPPVPVPNPLPLNIPLTGYTGAKAAPLPTYRAMDPIVPIYSVAGHADSSALMTTAAVLAADDDAPSLDSALSSDPIPEVFQGGGGSFGGGGSEASWTDEPKPADPAPAADDNSSKTLDSWPTIESAHAPDTSSSDTSSSTSDSSASSSDSSSYSSNDGS